jgi:predicted DNA-binding transcriptional regulator AlpA
LAVPAVALVLPCAALVQTDAKWPTKSAKWVVPLPPGGAMDVSNTNQPSISLNLPTSPIRFFRLDEVLKNFLVSHNTWYESVKRGIYPAPVQLSFRCMY